MAEATGIAWCDSTVNFWIGCTQISPACDHCYAMGMAKRMGIPWNAPPRRTKENSWRKPAQWQKRTRKTGVDPKFGRARRVFVNSMSDFFDNQAEQSWREEAMDAMEAAPNVVFILITKRPQLIEKFAKRWMAPGAWPTNVWLLTTVENQEEAERRIPHILKIPSTIVRGVSMEPMLGGITLRKLRPDGITFTIDALTGQGEHLLGMKGQIGRLNWIIIGGESGHHARSLDEVCVDAVIRQSKDAGAAVFFKQRSQADFPKTFGDYETFPEDLQIREFPA